MLDASNAASIELPKYQSHKIVWALKIKAISFDSDEAAKTNRETDGSAIITPEEDRYAPFGVDHEYVQKHKPIVGGYYVQYKDGYKSFSPAEAFEDGYAPFAPTTGPCEPKPASINDDPILQFFNWKHLPQALATVSAPFGSLAREITDRLPRNPERTVALRKLLESKDCAVRAVLMKQP